MMKLDPDTEERVRGSVNFPAQIAADAWRTTIGNPEYYLGRACSDAEIEAYARAISPDGWQLLHIGGRVRRGNFDGVTATYCRTKPVEPPWSVDELRSELELCGGDWQAVAAALGTSYRELRRWLDEPAFAGLEPLWTEERERVASRGRGEASRSDVIPRDPDTLRTVLQTVPAPSSRYVGPLLATVRMLELYVDAAEEGRAVPDGAREYLRRAKWIRSSPSSSPQTESADDE